MDIDHYVIISISEPVTDPHEIRLVGGPVENSGRVEIFYGGVWGTVCNISWDIDDASVVCHQLGYPDALSLLGPGTFTEGEGVVWLEGIDCHGNETTLTECSLSNWGESRCDHTHDAGVVCESQEPSSSSLPMTSSDFASMPATSPLMLLPFSPSHDQQATPTVTMATRMTSNGQLVTNSQRATPTVATPTVSLSDQNSESTPWVPIILTTVPLILVAVVATVTLAVIR